MPELPEVETIRLALAPALVGARIASFSCSSPRQVRPSTARLAAALRGRTILAIERRAKWLLLRLDDGQTLLIHLRMSGRLELLPASPDGAHLEERPRAVRRPGPPDRPVEQERSQPAGHVFQRALRFTRAVLSLADGRRLLFVDMRRFGRIVLTRRPAALLARLGIEPLDQTFTPAWLGATLSGRRRALKPLLLDQTVIAGLGNIYADEALHRARLHPLRPADSLRPAEVAALHGAIIAALRLGLAHNGTSLDWIYPEGRMQDYLAVYGRTGQPCRRCGTPIASGRVAQRGTHWCPACQPAPRHSTQRRSGPPR